MADKIGEAYVDIQTRFDGIPGRWFFAWVPISLLAIGVLTTMLILRPVRTVEVAPAVPVDPVPEFLFTMPGGGTIHAIGDVPLSFEGDIADLIGAVESTSHRNAEGRGASVSNVGSSDYQAEIDATAPSADIGDVHSFGGASNTAVKAITKNGGLSLMILGGVLIAGGFVVMLWLQMRKLGFALMAGGAAVCLIAIYPWMLLVAGAIGLVAAGLWFYDAKALTNKAKGFNVLVRGVENANGSADATKEEISKAARAAGIDRALKREVSKVKRTM